jgi:hypothetical protein
MLSAAIQPLQLSRLVRSAGLSLVGRTTCLIGDLMRWPSTQPDTAPARTPITAKAKVPVDDPDAEPLQDVLLRAYDSDSAFQKAPPAHY